MITTRFIITCVIILYYVTHTHSTQTETDLRRKLTISYDKSARPVLNDKDSVNVLVELVLRQLIAINEKEENIELAVWSRIKWNDPNLRWNKTKYRNMKKLNFRSGDIWVPDITLYNYAQDAVDFGGNMDTMNTRIVVDYNGNALWMAPIILKASCKIKVDDFPFDVQHCFFKFGSWTYEMDRLNVTGEQMFTEFYTVNQEWHLYRHETVRTEVAYPVDCPGQDCPDPVYPDVTFNLFYKRKPLFYQANLIYPIFLLTLLTILTFLLPTDSGERITIAVTMLLAVIVFLHMVAEMVPESGEATPRLKVFFFFCMTLMFTMTIALCFVSIIYSRGERRMQMGDWMRENVYGKLAFYMKTRHNVCRCGGEAGATDAVNAMERQKSNPLGSTGLNITAKMKKNIPELAEASKRHEKLMHESCMDEWRVVAATINQILFILFSVVFFIGCLVTFTY